MRRPQATTGTSDSAARGSVRMWVGPLLDNTLTIRADLLTDGAVTCSVVICRAGCRDLSGAAGLSLA